MRLFSTVLICLIASGSLAIHAPAQTNSPQTATQDSTESKLRFQFQESDWKDVIPWFADQAGFSLQPISDWPSGTFYLKDDSEYTVMQALDQINHALRMRDPAYTLIRNRKMLILTRLDGANFPDELIETVSADELDERGKYETISVIFDLDELDATKMFEEVKPLINDSNRNFFAVFPAANQIHVRETGGTLRDIRALIEAAKERAVQEKRRLQVYRLQYVDAETFMIVARGLLGMDANSDATDDDTLSISREPFGDRLFLRGTDAMLKRFKEVAEVVDVPAEEETGTEVVKQSFKTYPILIDPKLGFDLLQTVLEGTGARMQQDSVTGAITVLGRPEDHDLVSAALSAVAGQSGEAFEIIKIETGSASDIMLAVQSLLRQTTTTTVEGTPANTGPVVMANSVLNQILVRGTPQEVAEVKRMVLQLDANSIPPLSGPRTGTRIINVEPGKTEQISPMLEDLLHASGRTNRLNIVLPDQRKQIRSRLRGLPEPDDSPSDNEAGRTSNRPDNSQLNGSPSATQGSTTISLRAPALFNFPLGLTSMLYVPVFQETGTDIGKTSQTPATGQNPTEYLPPEQQTTVPGAPIEVRFTEYGIVLQSEDLDALDDLEQMILQQLGENSEEQLPTFFFLKHRQAVSMRTFLEQYFGMADSGAGGGGGGGLMEGMMNNMLGGGTGDLLGGLLGGPAPLGASGAGVLEGSVRFGVDVKFNALYVAGATENDLDQVAELIDVLDQPEAPHEPDLVGEFRTIQIIHRDPTEIKDLVAAQLADYINAGSSEGGGNQENREVQQLTRMMNQLSGRNGGGNEDAEQEKPKVKLDVDLSTNRLLVTGPEFIYNKIVLMVDELDVLQPSPPTSVQILKRQGNADTIRSTLEAMYGTKIEYVVKDEETSSGSGTASSGNQSGASNNSREQNQAVQRQQQQAREAIVRAIRQQARGQGGSRGGGGGGGRGGGGGGRGGGGR